jgi:hypothetical protein
MPTAIPTLLASKRLKWWVESPLTPLLSPSRPPLKGGDRGINMQVVRGEFRNFTHYFKVDAVLPKNITSNHGTTRQTN